MPKVFKVADLPLTIDQVLVAQHNQFLASMGAIGVLPHHERTTLVNAPAASDLATSIVLANDLRAKYIAHITSTDAHVAADATNTISSPVASDLTTVQNLLNEIKTDFSAHIALLASHRGVGGQGGVTIVTVSTTNASDQTTANALANALKAALNNHIGAGAPDLQLVAS